MGKLAAANRPRYLFSGLTKCGVCGAGFIMGYANRLCCFGARDQGTCSNKLTIRWMKSRRVCSGHCSRVATQLAQSGNQRENSRFEPDRGF
jgi:hypothetical protein